MVGPREAIRLGFQRFIEPGGRSTRAEFWWWWLFYGALVLPFEQTFLGPPIILGLFVPSLMVLIRRLHDTGRSGWYGWVFLIPAIGVFVLAFFLAQRGEQGSNAYGPPPAPGAGFVGGSRPEGWGGIGDALRDRWQGGDAGPQRRTTPPHDTTHDTTHATTDDSEDQPRSSGWDDLPPPAPPSPR